MVRRILQYVDPKMPVNVCTKLKMWHVACEEGIKSFKKIAKSPKVYVEWC